MYKTFLFLLIFSNILFAQLFPRSVQWWHLADGAKDSLLARGVADDTTELKTMTFPVNGSMVYLRGYVAGDSTGNGLFYQEDSSFAEDGESVFDNATSGLQWVRADFWTKKVAGDTADVLRTYAKGIVSDSIATWSDTTAMKADNAVKGLLLQDGYEGMFYKVDSTEAEGIIAYDCATAAKQYVDLDFIKNKRINVGLAGLKGNGSTDNESAFESIITKHGADSVTIVFPKGNFLFKRTGKGTTDLITLTNKKNLTIEGQGIDQTILRIDSLSARLFVIDSCQYVTIKNMTIRGDSAGTDPSALHGIRITNDSRDITLDNIAFDKVQLQIAGDSEKLRLSNLKFYNMAWQPLSINQMHQSTLDNFYFYKCGGLLSDGTIGAPIVFDSGTDNILTNFELDSCARIGKFQADEDAFENNIISNFNCILLDVAGTPGYQEVIEMLDVGDLPAYDFTHNQFNNWTIIMEDTADGTNLATTGNFISIEDTVCNTKFSNWTIISPVEGINIFEDCYNLTFDNIHIEVGDYTPITSHTRMSNMNFNNCYFKNTGGTPNFVLGTAAGGIDSAYTFTGCTFDMTGSSDDNCVDITDAKDVKFVGCTVSGGNDGISPGGTTYKISVVGSTIKNAVRGIDNSCDSLRVVGCNFYDNTTLDIRILTNVENSMIGFNEFDKGVQDLGINTTWGFNNLNPDLTFGEATVNDSLDIGSGTPLWKAIKSGTTLLFITKDDTFVVDSVRAK